MLKVLGLITGINHKQTDKQKLFCFVLFFLNEYFLGIFNHSIWESEQMDFCEFKDNKVYKEFQDSHCYTEKPISKNQKIYVEVHSTMWGSETELISSGLISGKIFLYIQPFSQPLCVWCSCTCIKE